MTVCIGAICDDGNTVIAAADRMMTFGAPMNLQAEGAVRKIQVLNEYAVLLFSGSVPEGEFLTAATRQKITAAGEPGIKDIADMAALSYQELKQKRVEDTILRPLLGVNFQGFQQLLSQSASSQLLQQVLGMISQHNLQVDVMIAGIDDSAHLYVITHPGTVLPMDTVGTAAIGSGGTHAAVSMSLAEHRKGDGCGMTMFNVFEAKVSSEVAPGVGKVMDMVIINQHGANFVDDEGFHALSSIHKEKPTLEEGETGSLDTLASRYLGSPT